MERSLKKILAGALALLTVAAYVPVNPAMFSAVNIVASADEEGDGDYSEAEGITSEKALIEAINNAKENGEEAHITLDGDIQLTNTLVVEENLWLELNLNGYMISAAENVDTLFEVRSGALLRIGIEYGENGGVIDASGKVAVKVSDRGLDVYSGKILGSVVVEGESPEYSPYLTVGRTSGSNQGDGDPYIEEVKFGLEGPAGALTLYSGHIGSVLMGEEWGWLDWYFGEIDNEGDLPEDKVYREAQEATEGEFNVDFADKTFLKSVKIVHTDGEEENISIRSLRNLAVEVGAKVTIVSEKLIDIKNDWDRLVALDEEVVFDEKAESYTYSFTMPGYNVKYDYRVRQIYKNTEGLKVESDTEIKDDWLYYPNSLITVYSYNEISINNTSGGDLNVTEEKGEYEDDYNEYNYKYTFVMPDADVSIDEIMHEHRYTFEVSEDKTELYRYCANEQGYCDEEHGMIFVASVYVGDRDQVEYCGSEHSVGVNCDDYGFDATYYSVDKYGYETQLEGNWEVVNVGNYIARVTFYTEEGEYVLEKAFEVVPFELTDEFVHLGDDQSYHETWGGAIVQPYWEFYDFWHNHDMTEFVDYIITGVDATNAIGSHVFTVHGIGNYSGSVDLYWDLGGEEAVMLTEDMVTITTEYINGYAYAVVKIMDGDYELSREWVDEHNGPDFILGGVRRTAEGGTYTILIQGQGKYYGTLEMEWSVSDVDITGNYASINDVTYDADNSKLSFVSRLAAPTGTTVKSYGMVITANEADAYSLSVDYAKMKPADVIMTAKDGSAAKGYSGINYTLTKTKVGAGDTWYAKAYITYIDADGKEHTAYSSLIKAVADGDFETVQIAKAAINSTSYNADTKKLSAITRFEVPAGCTIKNYAVIATNDAKQAEILDKNNNSIFLLKDGVDGYSAVNYTLTKTKVEVGDTWYFKAYIVYVDADGVTREVYGELVTATAE